MSLDELKISLKSQVGNNLAKKVLEYCELNLKNAELLNEIFVIKSRLTEINKNHNSGSLNYDKYLEQKAKVANSTLELVSKISAGDLNELFFSNNEDNNLDKVGLNEVAVEYEIKLKNITAGEKFKLIGRKNAIDGYINAIKKTSHQFYTTSFLDSEFWQDTSQGVQIIHENSDLYKRIKQNSKSGGGLKRLFIVPDFLDSYVYNIVDYAITLEKLGKPKPLKDLIEINENLKELSNSIEMKIIEKDKMPKIFDENFNPLNNLELALYDNFRIDVFSLNRDMKIEDVEIYTKNYILFNTIKNRFLKFFMSAWNKDGVIPIRNYIDQIDEQIAHQKEQRIDYETNWLLKYHHYVLNEHPVLNSEKTRVVGFLQSYTNNNSFQFNNYLDIGVCTGRYPTVLNDENFVENVDSIDSDYDVEIFLKTYMPELNFLRVDIRSTGVPEKLNKTYDLITCMLGTVCHFGLRKSNSNFNNQSGIDRALNNILKLININGLLIISTWKKWSVLTDKIELYSKKDIAILQKNNPTKEILSEKIDEISSGGVLLLDHLKDEYFDIYIYKRIRF